MARAKIRYESTNISFDGADAVFYPRNEGAKYYTAVTQNPRYAICTRDLPTTEVSWTLGNMQETDRDALWDFWNDTIDRGKYLPTLVDDKKRLLFHLAWPSWKEEWRKARGGVWTVNVDGTCAYPWTPPLFAFYPFTSYNASGAGDHCLDSANELSVMTGWGEIADDALVLTEDVVSAIAAQNESLTWKQQKDNSSISFVCKFRVGDPASGAQIDIVNLTDGNNTLRLYIRTDMASSSSISSSDSSETGPSSSTDSTATSESSSTDSSTTESSATASSSQTETSPSSATASSTSTSSSKTTSSESSASSSTASSSSSSETFSSASSTSVSNSATESSNSSESSSPSSTSDVTSSSSSSTSASSSSSSQEGTTQMTLVWEWTKSGQSAESVQMDEVNIYSESVREWYDICGTFDNVNNRFAMYICRSAETTKNWSYTNDFLQGTTSLTAIPENSLVKQETPTNYPEDVTWTKLYLLKGNQADIYTTDADKAELKYCMIVDEYVSPQEFNWIRRLFHYWHKTSGTWPK